MSRGQSTGLLEQAKAAGLLPASAELAATPERPWPLVLLTALGAWLAAVPLLIFTYTMLGDALTRGAGPYGVGSLMLVAAVVLLRSSSANLFLEQLAVPALLVGASTLALGLYRDLQTPWASALLMLAALALAALIARPWLRALLGAAAAVFFGLALMPSSLDLLLSPGRLWLIAHAGLVLGVAGLALQQRHLLQGQYAARAAQAAYLEMVGAGWLVMQALALALVGSLDHGLWGSMSPAQTTGWPWACSVASTALALAGAALAARAWPALRRRLALAVALVLAGLCLWLPMLGGALLLLAFSCSTHRWRLALAGAFAAAWVLGASYYQLSWPLSDKALVLLAAAGLLALIAWLAAQGQDRTAGAAKPAVTRMPGAAWILMAGLLSLALINGGIWQKQRLIAEGRPVFVALAPVDPRSLMQGDYMRLNYELGTDITAATLYRLGPERPRLVLKVDQRGLGLARRLHEAGTPLAADEQLIELSAKNGGWTLVSDAWFFREGDGQRWQAAKYGEFRVRADGQALLVGLADAQLKRIEP